MKHTEALQEKLYNEILSHIKQDDVTRRTSGATTSITRARSKDSSTRSFAASKELSTAPEEVILDLNELAKGQKFMSVGAFVPSDDGRSAGVFDRQHRLPSVHAAGQEPDDRRAAAGSGGTRRQRRVGHR